MKKEQGKTGSKLTNDLYILESGICINILEKNPSKHWYYFKVHTLSENRVFYFVQSKSILGNYTTAEGTEAEFPLHFTKVKELQREKLERLIAKSNKKAKVTEYE